MCVPDPFTLPTIDFIGGATQELVFHAWSLPGKRPFDLAGCRGDFSMTEYVNRDGEPVLSKTMKVERSTEPGSDEETENLLIVTLTPEDTAELEGKFVYQITVRDGEGNTDIPNQGIIYIFKNINEGFVK